MDKLERSKLMTARLMAIIAAEAPTFSLESGDSRNPGIDPARYAADRFIREILEISEAVENAEENREYFRALRENVKCLPPETFQNDPYLSEVRVLTAVRQGRYTLAEASYQQGELFAYDMPVKAGELVIPRLGFTTETVHFPAIYEGIVPWMSVCPSEINSVGKDAQSCAVYLHRSSGSVPTPRILALGLGLGYFPFRVQKRISNADFTIVEQSPEIISLFTKYLLPQFPDPERIRVVRADALDFLNDVRRGDYDYVYADIWQGEMDGAEAYLCIRRHEARMPETKFGYWIEEEIKTALEDL